MDTTPVARVIGAQERSIEQMLIQLIHEGNHDLVLEAANAMNEADLYVHNLRIRGPSKNREDSWTGTYVTLNPSNYPWFGIPPQWIEGSSWERANWKKDAEKLFKPENSPIHLPVDGMDALAIDFVLESTAAQRPVYVVQRAIGIMLTYITASKIGSDLLHTRGREFDEGIEKMAKHWIGQLTSTKLRQIILTSAVSYSEDELIDGGNRSLVRTHFGAGFPGINRATEHLLLTTFAQQGWTTRVSRQPYPNFELRLYDVGR